jgi:hypothetical protein
MAQTLSRRDTSLLRAVAQDRCEIVLDPQPVLLVDGRVFCDTAAGQRLLDAGLLERPGIGSGRWPARLTSTGEKELGRLSA